MWIGGRELLIGMAAAVATYLATAGIPPGLALTAAWAAQGLGEIGAAERLIQWEAGKVAPSGQEVASSEALRHLAAQSRTRGRHAEAVTYLGRAQVLLERAVGPRDPEVAGLLDELALVSMERADFTGAVAAQKRALTIRTAAFGVSHPRVVLTLERMARLRRREGDLDEALRYARRALASLERLPGCPQADLARAFSHVGGIQHERGQLEAADLYLGRALEILDPDGTPGVTPGDAESLDPARRHALANAFAEAGALRSTQGRFRIARRFLSRAFALHAGGPDASARQAETLLALAHTFRDPGQRATALAHLRVALRVAGDAPRIPALRASIHEALAASYDAAGATQRARRHRSIAERLLARSPERASLHASPEAGANAAPRPRRLGYMP